jgi:hypothetical protein
MKLEVKKEFVGGQLFYCIYVNGAFVLLTREEENLPETIKKVKEIVLNKNEVVYSEEF